MCSRLCEETVAVLYEIQTQVCNSSYSITSFDILPLMKTSEVNTDNLELIIFVE